MPATAGTIPAALDGAAKTGTGGIVFHHGDAPERLDLPGLRDDAGRRAAVLLERGIVPGDAVGLLGANHPEWARWAFAVWAAGAVLVPLPHPVRVRDPAAFAEQVAALTRAAGCRAVVTEPRLLVAVPPGLGLGWDSAPSSEPAGGPAASPDDAAVIQFTSGSTADPKGAVLTHRGILAAIAAASAASRIDPPTDRLLGWLPLFHDYGLFGYLVRPVVQGIEGHVLATERFASEPAEWFRALSREGATMTSGPSSAWGVALRAATAEPDGIDLSSLRVGVLAAETIEPEVVDRLTAQGPSLGLRPGALAGAYGMAEATLGLTMARPGGGIRIDRVDLEALAADGRAEPATEGRTKRVASCGEPIPDVELRIAGPGGPGEALPERAVGEVLARAPSVMRGYLGAEPGGEDPFQDGWLRTGDLGYVAEGELFLTGRRKEIVVAVGRNYAPEDLEWAASRVRGVRAGRVVAFGRPDGGEGEVVIVVEPDRDADPAALPRKVRSAVMDAVGLTPREVLVLAPGSIPKTTSGKLRRTALRDAYRSGELDGRGAG